MSDMILNGVTDTLSCGTVASQCNIWIYENLRMLFCHRLLHFLKACSTLSIKIKMSYIILNFYKRQHMGLMKNIPMGHTQSISYSLTTSGFRYNEGLGLVLLDYATLMVLFSGRKLELLLLQKIRVILFQMFSLVAQCK
jgi:hypothetical protein